MRTLDTNELKHVSGGIGQQIDAPDGGLDLNDPVMAAMRLAQDIAEGKQSNGALGAEGAAAGAVAGAVAGSLWGASVGAAVGAVFGPFGAMLGYVVGRKFGESGGGAIGGLVGDKAQDYFFGPAPRG